MSDSRFCTVGFFLGCLWLVLVNLALLWGNQGLTGVWAYPSGLPMAGAGIAMSLGFAGCVIYGPGVLAFLFGRRREEVAAPLAAPRRQAPTLPQEPARPANRAPFRVAPQPVAAETPARAFAPRVSPPASFAPEPSPVDPVAVERPSPSAAAAPAARPGPERPTVDDRFKPMPMVVRRRTPLMVHERRDWVPVEEDEASPEQPAAPAPVAEEPLPGRPVALPPLPVPTVASFEAIEPLALEPVPPVAMQPEPPPAVQPARRAATVPVTPMREPAMTRTPLFAGGSIRDRKPRLRPVDPDRPEGEDHSAASGRPAAALRSA